MNEISVQEISSALILLLNNPMLYMAIGAFIIVCMLVLILINKKSGTFLLWFSISYLLVGSILYSLPKASDAIISVYAQEYAYVGATILENLLSKFKDIGILFIIVAIVFALLYILAKVLANKKIKMNSEKQINALAELDDKNNQ